MLKRWLPWGVLATAWFAFFSRLIVGGKVYFLDDLKIIYYPLEKVYAVAQYSWQLPIWSPLFGFGQPVIGWGQLGFFTPVHIVLRALFIPPVTLLQLSVMIYFALGMAGMYLFLRQRHFSTSAATLGAGLFAFCGFSIGHLNHVNFYTATMLLPWLLVAVQYFMKQPTLRRTVLVALLGAAMALSGQPQVVAYSFLIAGIYGLSLLVTHRPLLPRITFAVVAAGLAVGLASFALLPLKEFLPLTERGEDLPPAELTDFSYPPHHAITLLFPYFYGNHEAYWGAKGFQELAAYVGIIPLFLAGVALANWKEKRTEKVVGSVFVLIGILMALGQYSFFYNFIITHHWLTTLSIPGRFVFFFDMGMVLLAACGLEDFVRSSKKRLLLGFILPILVVLPFAVTVRSDFRALTQLQHLWQEMPVDVVVVVVGVIACMVAFWQRRPWLLASVALISLLMYGWNYNPVISRAIAASASPLGTELETAADTGLPPRLYSTMTAVTSTPADGNSIKYTDELSPLFGVYQIVKVSSSPLSCLSFPFDSGNTPTGMLHLAIRPDLQSPPWIEKDLDVRNLSSSGQQTLCLPPREVTPGQTVVISFTATEATSVRLQYERNEQGNGYFVRKENPTPAELAQSRKPLNILISEILPTTQDREAAYIVRHMQAAYGSSSARWIGALSIKPYREFIEQFFANDQEQIDGDGVHAVLANRIAFDMTGVTHLITPLTSPSATAALTAQHFTLLKTMPLGDEEVGIFKNEQAFPKAYVVPNATFIAANDEARYNIKYTDFQADREITLEGNSPPKELPAPRSYPLAATAVISKYQPTHVTVDVNTPESGWLVLNDASTPQWHAYVDGVAQPYFVANTLFRTAQVPAGAHIVEFKYSSPAIELSKKLTLGSLAIATVLLILPWFKRKQAV